MSVKKTGKRVISFSNPPSIIGFASVAGKKEGQGPLGNSFDYVSDDTTFGEKSWEKAESMMQTEALRIALSKAGVSESQLDYICAGDLINQCVASSFSARGKDAAFIGLYGACSTMAESTIIVSALIDGGYADNAAAVTSSHFASAERQYRFPLEYGGQRTPTAQWTVTGAGAMILSSEGNGPNIKRACMGRIIDYGIKDANNMGAAMAPAAHRHTQYHFNIPRQIIKPDFSRALSFKSCLSSVQ